MSQLSNVPLPSSDQVPKDPGVAAVNPSGMRTGAGPGGLHQMPLPPRNSPLPDSEGEMSVADILAYSALGAGLSLGRIALSDVLQVPLLHMNLANMSGKEFLAPQDIEACGGTFNYIFQGYGSAVMFHTMLQVVPPTIASLIREDISGGYTHMALIVAAMYPFFTSMQLRVGGVRLKPKKVIFVDDVDPEARSWVMSPLRLVDMAHSIVVTQGFRKLYAGIVVNGIYNVLLSVSSELVSYRLDQLDPATKSAQIIQAYPFLASLAITSTISMVFWPFHTILAVQLLGMHDENTTIEQQQPLALGPIQSAVTIHEKRGWGGFWRGAGVATIVRVGVAFVEYMVLL